MDEENNYGINWIGLFLKVIAFVVIVLLAIWLISKLTLKQKGLSFEENNKLFTEATTQYFKDNLPKTNVVQTITLKQLIKSNYLEELKDEKGNACDGKKSTSKIELTGDYYTIKSVLLCEDKSETTYIKLGNEKCTDCDVKIEGLVIKEEEKEEEVTTSEDTQNNTSSNSANNNTSNTSSNSTSNTSNNVVNNTTSKKILYEYVKETTEYSDWYVGKVTGNNIENSTKNVSYSKYCKNESYTYRTAGYVTKVGYYTYTLELINLANQNISSVKNVSDGYFNSYQDYKEYLNNKASSLKMVGVTESGSFDLPSASVIKSSSLTSSNFDFVVSSIYKSNNRYYVNITTFINNLNGINPYYSSKIKSNVYFVPIKFTASYVNLNNCQTDKTENKANYNNYTVVETWNEKIDIYRYKNIISEYKYSNATSLEGYRKTGNTKEAD